MTSAMDPAAPATASQMISRARAELRARRRGDAARLTAELVPFAAPMPTAELKRLADLCEELALIPAEVEVRTLLVTRDPARRVDWRRLVKLHRALGDRKAADRARQRAAGSRTSGGTRGRGRWGRRTALWLAAAAVLIWWAQGQLG